MRLSVKNKKEDAHEDCIWSAGWAAKGSDHHLYTGSVDETVKSWAEDLSRVEYNYGGHTLGIISISLHSSGQWAGSSALDSFIRVWNTSDSELRSYIETPPSETWQVAFQPHVAEPIIAAAGGSSNKITLWSTETQEGSVLRSYNLPAVRSDPSSWAHATLSLALGKLHLQCKKQIITVAACLVHADVHVCSGSQAEEACFLLEDSVVVSNCPGQRLQTTSIKATCTVHKGPMSIPQPSMNAKYQDSACTLQAWLISLFAAQNHRECQHQQCRGIVCCIPIRRPSRTIHARLPLELYLINICCRRPILVVLVQCVHGSNACLWLHGST